MPEGVANEFTSRLHGENHPVIANCDDEPVMGKRIGSRRTAVAALTAAFALVGPDGGVRERPEGASPRPSTARPAPSRHGGRAVARLLAERAGRRAVGELDDASSSSSSTAARSPCRSTAGRPRSSSTAGAPSGPTSSRATSCRRPGRPGSPRRRCASRGRRIPSMAGSVLLVEDEESLASLVQAYLVQEGFTVAVGRLRRGGARSRSSASRCGSSCST